MSALITCLKRNLLGLSTKEKKTIIFLKNYFADTITDAYEGENVVQRGLVHPSPSFPQRYMCIFL